MRNGHKTESERRMDRIERAFELSIRRMDRAEQRMDRAEQRMDRAERRMDRLERLVAQNNRVVAGLAVAGRRLRSDVRQHEKWLQEHKRTMAESDSRMTRLEVTISEIGDKLNGLIGYVDGLPRPSSR